MRDDKIYDIFHVHRWDSNREIGIEIEMEGHGLNFPLQSYWQKDMDGSLRGEALEYRLTYPKSREDIRRCLRYLIKRAEIGGAVFAPSRRCGVHIHINCQRMTERETFNFICLYLVLEEVLTRWCGEDREGNLFCLRSSDAEELIYQLVYCKKLGYLHNIFGDRWRYASICIPALRKFGSLEFRTMPTPVNLLEIEDWIDLLLQVKKSSYKFKKPRDIVEFFSGQGEKYFLEQIMEEHTKKLMFSDVEDMLRNGVRRVQEIAYTKTQKSSKKSFITDSSYHEPFMVRWNVAGNVEVAPPIPEPPRPEDVVQERPDRPERPRRGIPRLDREGRVFFDIIDD